MKKSGIFAIFLILSTLHNANAALPTGATPYDVNVPRLAGGPTIGLTGLRWQTSVSEYDYALTHAIYETPCLFREENRYQTIDPRSSWNFKLTLGYIFPCSGNELTLGYVNYDQNATRFVAINNNIDRILPTLSDRWPVVANLLLTDPILGARDLFVTASPNFSSASTSIKLDVLDLDFSQYLNAGGQLRVKYYAGVRYAKIRNTLDVFYNYNNVIPSLDVLDTEIPVGITVRQIADFSEEVKQSNRYEGMGPRVGINLDYYLRWGFGLVGDVSTSVLAGKINTDLEDSLYKFISATVITSDLPDSPVGKIFQKTDYEQTANSLKNPQRIVPNFDGKIGINWSYQYRNCARSKLNIELGYMVSHYFNCADRFSQAEVHHPELRAFHKVNEYFNGIVVGFQYNF